MITIRKEGNSITLVPSMRKLNDFSQNQIPDETVLPPVSALAVFPSQAARPAPVVLGPEQVQPVVVSAPEKDIVEVITKIPHLTTKVTVTIVIELGGPSLPEKNGAFLQHPIDTSSNVRRLDRILCITCSPRLAKNIGAQEAQKTIPYLKGSAGRRSTSV